MVDLDKHDPIFREELDDFGYTIYTYVAKDIIFYPENDLIGMGDVPDVLFVVVNDGGSDEESSASETKLSLEKVCEIKESGINENTKALISCTFCLSEPAFAINKYSTFGLHFLCRDCMIEVGDACYQALKNNNTEVSASLI